MQELAFAALIVGVLFAAFWLALEVGFRLGARLKPVERPAITVVEGAVFGMLGLLLAFSFGTGIAHLDERRALVVREANAISTAYRRIDLLPPDIQPEMRSLFARYIDARLAAYTDLTNIEVSEKKFDAAIALQDRIWDLTMRVWRSPRGPQAVPLIVPALNDMFDITTNRRIALSVHNPALVLFLLVTAALMGSLLAGLALAARGSRSPLHVAVFAMMLALIIYTVVDLDYPRSGLIRIDAADKALTQLRDFIKSHSP